MADNTVTAKHTKCAYKQAALAGTAVEVAFPPAVERLGTFLFDETAGALYLLKSVGTTKAWKNTAT